MLNTSGIQADMPVVCSQGGQFAVVDRVEGNDFIKLKKDEAGNPHFIPLSWVTSISDGKVHIDRPGEEATNEWATSPLSFLNKSE